VILRGLPISLRRLPAIALDQLLRPFRGIAQSRPRVLSLVYFSCGRDFDILQLSLRSIANLRLSTPPAGIHVVVDSKWPFSSGQQDALKACVPSLYFHEGLGEIHDRSPVTILTELRAFATVAALVDPGSLIAKVDSDILFFSGRKLSRIISSRFDFVGDSSFVGGKFFQGGLYFMSADLALRLNSRATLADIPRVVQQVGCTAEDRVVSQLVRRSARSVWDTQLMLFPDVYERIDLQSWWVRDEYCALHFFAQKGDMPRFAARISPE
jgi:hypothetical protein